MNRTGKHSAGFGWLVRMAWRDGKAGHGKLLLFILSIALGVTAVVSIHAFSETLQESIAQQSKSLMGADYMIESDHPINDRVAGIIDSLGGAPAREINFLSMAAFPGKNATKLVDVRGLEGDFPFYGELDTEPASAALDFQRGGALMDATALLQLHLGVGDSIKIGERVLPIVGALHNIPGSNSFFGSIAPPVVIPLEQIESTGLVRTGSRIEYKYYFQAGPEEDLVKLDEALAPILDAEDADLDTHESESRRLGRRYDNFGKFLNLVGFIALLLGCVGIASGMNIHIREKLTSIAILKCLGASKRQAFSIYFIQVGLMGLLGGILGSFMALFIQRLFPILAQGMLPLDVVPAMAPGSFLLGIFLGLIMSLLFASQPLIDTLYISPLQALRVVSDRKRNPKWASLAITSGIVLFVFCFTYLLLGNLLHSLSFVLGLGLVFLIMVGSAHGVMGLIRKYFPHKWGFMSRQGLRNLLGPGNQTLTLLLAIGIGSFLMGTLYFSKDILLAKASIEDTSHSANMILMDVQREQMEEVSSAISSQGFPVIDKIPIVTMRVESLKGRGVDQIRRDTTSRVNRWILNHEFRVTYRDSILGSESLVGGQWFSPDQVSGRVAISVSDDFARGAEVGIGDPIDFNVQGRIMETEVGSIRSVDWTRLQPNFSIVFPKGVLENAPQFGVLTTRVPDREGSARLQTELVQKFPNVSILDLMRILELIEDILEKMSWVINFMAFFSIFVGAIVLMGAIYNSKYQRIRQSAILKTLGAKSSQILKLYAFEYAFLGLLGAVSGLILSLGTSLLLSWLLFQTSFVPSWIPLLAILTGIALLVFLLGVANSFGVIRSTPLEVLRGARNG